MVLAAAFAASCGEKEDAVEKPYFEVSPSSLEGQSVLGEGDAIVLSIKTNMDWTISVEYTGADKDWLKFEATEGSGSADVFGVVLRGDQGGERNCKITVATKDGSKKVDLDIKQGKFVPVPINLNLVDVIANATEAGKAEELLDFSYVTVQVAVPAKAENILSDDNCVIVTDGNDYIKAEIPGASGFAAGDSLKLELTEGTIMKENGGGYFMKLPKEPVSRKAGELNLKPAYIASTSVAGYPYALVKVGSCQAQESFVGKSWGAGKVTMDMVENEVGTVDVVIDSKASFASAAVPGNAGTVTGIVIDGTIHPRNAEDLSALTASRGKKYEVVDFKIKPIANILQYGGAANTYANVTNEGTTTVKFSGVDGWSFDGSSIEMNTSTKIAYVVAAASSFQTCYTTIGWTAGTSYYLYTTPIQEKTWGDLEFGFSVSLGKDTYLPAVWELTWSADGTNYKPVDNISICGSNTTSGNEITQKVTAYADSHYTAFFTIPESDALNAGDKLYVKCLLKGAKAAVPASQTVRLNCGFYLASAAKNDPAPQYDNILAAENFDNCFAGCDGVIGLPIDYMTVWSTATAYQSRNGWTVAGGRQGVRCVLLYNGENAIYSPKLSKLTSTSDITVKFKACLFTHQTRDNSAASSTVSNKTENITVTTSGGGTVGAIEWDSDPESDYYNWHTATVKISGATPETVVAINGNKTRGNFYVKDVIITK